MEIALERDEDEVIVTVADNGPGVPTHIQEVVETGTLEANHGIGRYLVNTIVTEYDGELAFVDTGPAGTTLRLTFRAADN